MRFQWRSDQCYLWLDYHSVPQSNATLQALAIRTLPLYACLSSVFVIVAPAHRHFETKMPCNLNSYLNRMWCRAEMFSFLCRRGLEAMYIAEGVGALRNAEEEEDRILEALFVFEGDCTCCDRLHKGMPCDKPVLKDVFVGLYGLCFYLSRLGRLGVRSEVMLQHKQRMLPKTYRFAYSSSSTLGSKSVSALVSKSIGQEKTVELFGDMIEELEVYISTHDCSDLFVGVIQAASSSEASCAVRRLSARNATDATAPVPTWLGAAETENQLEVSDEIVLASCQV